MTGTTEFYMNYITARCNRCGTESHEIILASQSFDAYLKSWKCDGCGERDSRNAAFFMETHSSLDESPSPETESDRTDDDLDIILDDIETGPITIQTLFRIFDELGEDIDTATAISLETPQPPNDVGLKESEWKKLPVRRIDDREDDVNCGVCLNKAIGETIVKLPECGHEFHRSCIIPWLRSHNTCPNCRSKVLIEKK